MKLFVSHAFSDSDLASELKEALRTAGHQVWEPGASGSDWRAEIGSAIRRSDAIIAILSTPAAPGFGVGFEIGLATGAAVPTLIVSRTAKGMPPDLASVPFVELTGENAHDVSAILRRVSELADVSPAREARLRDRPESTLSAVRSDPSLVDRLAPHEFEQLVANVYRELGYDVRTSERIGSTEVDVALGSDPLTIVEVKQYRRNNLISVGAVTQLIGTKQVTGAEKAILVSSSGFTAAAQALAAEAEVELVTIDELLDRSEGGATAADTPTGI